MFEFIETISCAFHTYTHTRKKKKTGYLNRSFKKVVISILLFNFNQFSPIWTISKWLKEIKIF